VTKTAKEGILRRQPSGKWAVCRSGRAPVEINAGDQLWIEVSGNLKLTRMEFKHFTGRRGGQLGEYYTTGGYSLHTGLRGLRAAIGEKGLICCELWRPSITEPCTVLATPRRALTPAERRRPNGQGYQANIPHCECPQVQAIFRARQAGACAARSRDPINHPRNRKPASTR
jgi:hypothetical protein